MWITTRVGSARFIELCGELRAMSSHGDTRYLELHGRQWRVVVYVPRHLRSVLGKAALRKGLKTDSLKVAQVWRWAALADLRKIIHEAETRAAATARPTPSVSSMDQVCMGM